jgi:hypothetical protein
MTALFILIIIIIITKVEDDLKQVVVLRKTFVNQILREGKFKEFINILLVRLAPEEFIHEGKVILIYFEVAVEFFLRVLLASLIVKFNQECEV